MPSRNVPFTPRPKSKQGNVSSGSDFSHGAKHPSMGGNSDKYRVPAPPRVRSGQGFGAVKRPAAPGGSSPRGVFPARKKGNFGRV